ncbi:hypothetical protein ACJ67_02210 [Methylophilus sp. TWE2]|nr:hypothetical protein ACJ67_02210 [Methylophilus sp. TWE2]
MSVQDENLTEFKRLIREAAKNAQSKGELGLHLISSISSEYDDYLARKDINKKTKPSSLFNLVKCVALFPVRIWTILKTGPINTDPSISNFIKSLLNEKVVRHSQVRVINTYKMLLVSDGAMRMVEPTNKDRRYATLQMILLTMLLPFAVALVWNVFADMRVLAFGYLTGTVFGFMFRDAYYRFWGRRKIFQFITARHPWLKPSYY